MHMHIHMHMHMGMYIHIHMHMACTCHAHAHAHAHVHAHAEWMHAGIDWRTHITAAGVNPILWGSWRISPSVHSAGLYDEVI